MRPIFKNNIAIFTSQGFLDGVNAESIIEPNDISFVVSKKPEAVFVSLKKIIFLNKKGLSIIVDSLKQIQNKIHCPIGLCEYDEKKYKTILSMFDNNLDFSLFESLKVLNLFFNKNIDFEKKILIYEEDSEQKNQLAIELYEVGYKPYVAKNKNEFLEKKEEYTKYGIIIHNSYIANAESKVNIYINNNIIFYNLGNFIDSTISQKFDLKYHNNLLIIGFKVFVFDITKVSSMNIHGINFLAKLSTAGAEYGTTFCMVGVDDKKISEKLKNDLEDSGIILYKNMEEFKADEDIQKEALGGGRIPSKNHKLTKNVISNLNTFVDISMHITEMLSQKKGKKISVKMNKLSLDNKEYIVSTIGAYGEINVLVTMAFSKKLLLECCKIFLNDTNNEEEILNGMAEYSNIVASKIKSNFILHKIKSEITLPRVFNSKEQALTFFGDRKGVLVELDFDGEVLKLFLSR